MTESFIVTLLLAVLFGVIFIYSLYCLIDLWMFKLKTVATNGHGEVKHISIYRFIFRLNGGTGAGRMPDVLFRIGLSLKIDGVVTIVALVATIILIAVTATLSIFTNATAAIITNNQIAMEEATEETTESGTYATDEYGNEIIPETDENGNWVENKDDERHETNSDDSEEETDQAEETETTEATMPLQNTLLN